MEEMIKITEHNGEQAVSAKILFDFLEPRSNFSTWIRRMFEYGFQENTDFIPFLEKSTGGRPVQDYTLTLDCAKEISMLQRSEKGRQARRYFIACEKKLKETSVIDSTVLHLLKDAVQSLQTLNQGLMIATESLIKHEERITKLEEDKTVKTTQPKPKHTRRKRFKVENPSAKGSTRDPFKINGEVWYSVSIVRAMHHLTSKKLAISKQNRHELRLNGKSIGIINSEGLKEIKRQA